MTSPRLYETTPGEPAASSEPVRLEGAASFLEAALAADVAGRLDEAVRLYTLADDAAERAQNAAIRAEALRRMAIAHHRRADGSIARTLCQRSHRIASAAGEELLAAQALNSLAAFDLAEGKFEPAQLNLLQVLRSPGTDAALRGRANQNLGIIANIQGRLDEAEERYGEALRAFRAIDDMRGQTMALNSLGFLALSRRDWREAEVRFQSSLELATRLGDAHLRGLAMISCTEVHIARGSHDTALQLANEALRIFDALGLTRNKADAYRVIGVAYRETRRVELAESRLRMAVDLARSAEAVLEEAQAARELALAYRSLGRNQDALRQLNESQRLFYRLDARTDLVDVASRMADLQNTYLAVVRDWGQSIESADSYTHGHCERVAEYAASVAGVLGHNEDELVTVRLGAYLHDLGKINTPHEVLNKNGRLTNEEFEVMKRHPVDGLELLAEVDFPWDIKPMIRWHHEKYCGGGYPDGLAGDAIPVNAQIICIADVFDALTTNRSYRDAMPRERALSVMEESRHWWRPDVYEAFVVACA